MDIEDPIDGSPCPMTLFSVWSTDGQVWNSGVEMDRLVFWVFRGSFSGLLISQGPFTSGACMYFSPVREKKDLVKNDLRALLHHNENVLYTEEKFRTHKVFL